jgi:mono/diheme cytochrome c family protein
MTPFLNACLGIAFLFLGICLTFLMYHIWSYPYGQETQEGTAPPRLIKTHRILGVLYLAIYIYFMIEMVPRLWAYQIELPARTVAHLVLGMAIGAILFVKIAIVRYFRHVGAILVPVLGTMLLICTFLLIGLSAPFAIRGAMLKSASASQGLQQPETVARVQNLLKNASFGDDVQLDELTTPSAMQQGEQVLFDRCVRCHDLRTVLSRPRTPQNWWQTVQRMAGRAALIDPMSETQQHSVTAYLVAISPQLQESRHQQQEQQSKRSASSAAVKSVTTEAGATDSAAPSDTPAFDADASRIVFETKCSQCHEATEVDNYAFNTKEDVNKLVQRMVDEGLEASEEEFSQIIKHLAKRIEK